MKNIEAYNLLTFLNGIADKTKGLLAFRIAKNMRVLKTELTEYEQFRLDLFKKYGKEIGEKIIITDENKADFIRELAEYGEEPFSAELYKIDDEMLSSSDLNANEIAFLLDHLGKE